jgi:hypothetical protein
MSPQKLTHRFFETISKHEDKTKQNITDRLDFECFSSIASQNVG